MTSPADGPTAVGRSSSFRTTGSIKQAPGTVPGVHLAAALTDIVLPSPEPIGLPG